MSFPQDDEAECKCKENKTIGIKAELVFCSFLFYLILPYIILHCNALPCPALPCPALPSPALCCPTLFESSKNSFFPCVCGKLVKNDGSLVVCRYFVTSSSLILGISFSLLLYLVFPLIMIVIIEMFIQGKPC